MLVLIYDYVFSTFIIITNYYSKEKKEKKAALLEGSLISMVKTILAKLIKLI